MQLKLNSRKRNLGREPQIVITEDLGALEFQPEVSLTLIILTLVTGIEHWTKGQNV